MKSWEHFLHLLCLTFHFELREKIFLSISWFLPSWNSCHQDTGLSFQVRQQCILYSSGRHSSRKDMAGDQQRVTALHSTILIICPRQQIPGPDNSMPNWNPTQGFTYNNEFDGWINKFDPVACCRWIGPLCLPTLPPIFFTYQMAQ
jgi:hypothetical protein